MKLGPRKPSLKRSIKARTTGKLKRNIKRSINPTYGKKGMGWVKNPKKAAYNKVYNKTTFSVLPQTTLSSSNKKIIDTSKNSFKVNKNIATKASNNTDVFYSISENKRNGKKWGYWWVLVALLFVTSGPDVVLFVALIACFIIYRHNKKVNKVSKGKRIYLTDKEIAEIMNKVSELSLSNDMLLNEINTTLKPNIYFNSIEEFKNVADDINELINTYNLPLNYELGAKQESKIETRENIDELFNELTNVFINRFFETTQSQAAKLKTKKGYLNRMNKDKEELLQYKPFLTDKHLEIIDELWG